jgi:hypothetical protein
MLAAYMGLVLVIVTKAPIEPESRLRQTGTSWVLISLARLALLLLPDYIWHVEHPLPALRKLLLLQ